MPVTSTMSRYYDVCNICDAFTTHLVPLLESPFEEPLHTNFVLFPAKSIKIWTGRTAP